MMATLLLSQGVPMLRHGDEFGHSQQGNNNAYCQDNELSWVDWENADEDFMEFCAQLVAFRREHPVFTRRRFFEGEPVIGSRSTLSDIGWFRPDGVEMDGRGLGDGIRQVPRRLPQRPGACPTPTSAGTG